MAIVYMMSYILGPPLFAFASIFATFLVGIALGSYSAGRFIDEHPGPLKIYGMLEGVLGIYFLVLPFAINWITPLYTVLYRNGGHPFYTALLLRYLLFSPLLLAPSILMGSIWPVMARISRGSLNHIGRDFGIYALGGCAGALAAGFFMLPGLGATATIRISAGIELMICLAAFALSRKRVSDHTLEERQGIDSMAGHANPLEYTGIQRIVLFGYGIALFCFMVYLVMLLRLLPVKSGIFSTLHIEKGRGKISLLIDGTTVCSLPRDLSSRVLAGHIPLLFHEDPRDVLLIGLECGSTLHAIEQHPVRIVDCVEIHPQMCEGSNQFYDFHQGIREDPRLRMIHDNARHYLMFTGMSYDVIVCQPYCVPPKAIPELFTGECFHLCRKRLSPGGIAALRIPCQGMNEGILRSILSAWHRVFPFTTLWETALGREYLITGSDRRMEWNNPLINDRIQRPGIASDYASIRIKDPSADILSLFVMGGQGLLSYCQDASPLSDGRALRESTLPHRAGDHSTEFLPEGLQLYRGRGIEGLIPSLQSPECSSLREKLDRATAARHCLTRACIDIERGEPRKKIMLSLREAMEKAPTDREVVRFYAETLLIFAREYFIQGQYDMALLTLKEITHAMPENTDAVYLLGRTYYAMGLIEQARGEYEKVVARWQDDEEVRCHLGMAYLNSGWTDLAIDQFTRSIRFDPFYAEPHLYLGAAYSKKDLLDQAIEEYEKALAIRPDYADAHYNLGIAFLKRGLIDEAVNAWNKVIGIRPDDVKARYNLAMAYYNHGELDQSMAQLEEILKIKPDFVQARSLLNLLNQAQGR